MNPEAAESVALRGLCFVADSPERLGRFLAATGVDPEELRARAADPELLAGLLDYLLSDEALLVGFCESDGCDPSLPGRARTHLPGFAGSM
jgi:hypothetical protein